MVFVYGAALRATDGERVFTTRSAVCGFQMRPVHVSCDGDVAGITVRFTPAGLSCFMPGSLEDAALQRFECRDVFGQRAIERSMRDFARDCGISERTLERRFRHAIGASPKAFARMVRLQQALRSRQAQGLAWSELAIDAGYYDQAHLIRDARMLFGATPQALVATQDDSMASRFSLLSQATGLASMIFR